MKFSPRNTPFKLTLGERGEMIAWDYLRRAGYKILEKNYRCKIGEIDVVAERGGRLRFIEIKTRSSVQFGRPEEAVSQTKQKKLILLAEWYRKEKKLSDKPVSFEVMAIQWNKSQDPEIRIIENAFNADPEG